MLGVLITVISSVRSEIMKIPEGIPEPTAEEIYAEATDREREMPDGLKYARARLLRARAGVPDHLDRVHAANKNQDATV